MGTTESIFYEEETLEQSADNDGAGIRPARPSLASRSRRSVQRKPPQGPMRLSGLVLGMSQSGKQTLLSRLEGKDPFGDDSLDDHSERAATVVPYKAPEELQVWDQLQLHVRVSRSITGKNATVVKDPVDFALILINPTHSRSRIRSYLMESISALLRLQGYGGQATSSHDRPSPFCLCLLLGFRDRYSSSSSSNASWLEQSEVQQLTMEVLQEYPDLEPNRLVLQCGQASLFNCYGLDLLHHFIYQSYLQRKRGELESFLDKVHTARMKSNEQVPAMDYHDFLEMIGESDVLQVQSTDLTDGSERRRRSKKERRKRREEVRNSSLTRPNAEPTTARRRDSQQRRKIVPVATEAFIGEDDSAVNSDGRRASSPVDAKAALEAFLASDSDGEENTVAIAQQATSIVDEEEEEDDEFFYDSNGRRRSTVLSLASHDSGARRRRSKGSSSRTRNASPESVQRDKPDEDTRRTEQSAEETTAENSSVETGRDHVVEEASNAAAKGGEVNYDGDDEGRQGENAMRKSRSSSSTAPMESLQGAGEITPRSTSSDSGSEGPTKSVPQVATPSQIRPRNADTDEDDRNTERFGREALVENRRPGGTECVDGASEGSSEKPGSGSGYYRYVKGNPEHEQAHEVNVDTSAPVPIEGRSGIGVATEQEAQGKGDDEEFFLGGASGSDKSIDQEAHKQISADVLSDRNNEASSGETAPESHRETVPVPSNGALSSAALAAIAAAEREAELMLAQDPIEGTGVGSNEKKKREKGPKKKKKSKDKKSRRRTTVNST